MTTFTQKHYEHVARELHVRHPRARQAIEVMASIFERDNPKFKRRLFEEQCREGVQPREQTNGRH